MSEDKRTFGKIEFRGQRAYVCEGFISQAELDKIIEAGLHIYGIRHDKDDNCIPVTIETNVIAYHFGLIITNCPLKMDGKTSNTNHEYIFLKPDESEEILCAAGVHEGQDPYTLEEITGIAGWCNNE